MQTHSLFSFSPFIFIIESHWMKSSENHSSIIINKAEDEEQATSLGHLGQNVLRSISNGKNCFLQGLRNVLHYSQALLKNDFA